MEEDKEYKHVADFIGNWLKKDDHVIYVKDNGLTTGTIVDWEVFQIDDTKIWRKAVIRSDFRYINKNGDPYYPVDSVIPSNIIQHNIPKSDLMLQKVDTLLKELK